MKKEYNNFEDFNKDLEREYSFRDIAEINSWIDTNEMKGYMIKCPFHGGGKERTPSCQIGIETGHLWYRCYGCGSKGNVYNFAMNLLKISFVEAVSIIAESIGCSVNLNGYDYKKVRTKRDKLQKLWEKYQRDYINCKNDKVLNVGKRFFPMPVGYDKEADRVVLPFMSQNDTVLGFTMRRVDDSKDVSKWKHSFIGDSLVSECLNIYNIKVLSKNEEVIIVEGPGDVASYIRAGFDSVVCVCGTSNINEKVIELIKSKGIKKIILSPDGDDPGRKALFKWIKTVAKYDFILAQNIEVIIIPEGTDPGESNPDTLKECYDNRTNGLEYMMNNLDQDQIREIYNERQQNILFKKYIKEFVKELNSFNDNEAYAFFNGNINYEKKNKEQSDEYVNRLMATANYSDYSFKYDKLEMTEAQAKKILKLKFGIEC